MNTLRWLHMSDIHFKGNEQYETKRMRDSLIEELKKVSIEKNIDLIFITGDLAYQGLGYDKDLEKFIQAILSSTGATLDNLFIVPGNHDLKRSQQRKFSLEGLRKDGVKLESDTIETLEKGFALYKKFYKKIKKEDWNCIYKVINKGDINIILLNTAFTAGTDSDEGNLNIHREEFYKAISELKSQENCINIVLGHHPIKCFKSRDQKIIQNNFDDYNIDFYLCGHIHKGGYDYDLNTGRLIPAYSCGSCMVDGYATVTFVIGDLDLDAKKVTLTYYKWLLEEECWTVGGADGRKAISGTINLILERFKNDDFFVDVDINEDEFRRFMMEFHEKVAKTSIEDANIDPRDVFDKFHNMKCNKSVDKQYNSLCRYFPIIDEIMESSLLTQIEKESIPNIVISEYNKLIDNFTNGNEIIEGIVENMFKEYSTSFKYSNTILKTYFKILVYWSIYVCDIFNDKK